MDKFSIKFNEELVTRFLANKNRESTHTIMTSYQSAIRGCVENETAKPLPC